MLHSRTPDYWKTLSVLTFPTSCSSPTCAKTGTKPLHSPGHAAGNPCEAKPKPAAHPLPLL